MNNKGADQTVWMRCSQTPKTGFLASRPICYWSTLCYDVRLPLPILNLNFTLMHPTKFQCNPAKVSGNVIMTNAKVATMAAFFDIRLFFKSWFDI